MPDLPHDSHLHGVPDAVVAPKGRWSLQLVWLVPVVAALIGGGIAAKTILDYGPTITITFRAAEGLEANKTKVKYKNVDVGEVKQVAISEDLTHIVVTAEMVKTFAPHLVAGTRFWIVKPRIAAGQVTGIGTLFSGSYIELDVGRSTETSRAFEGLELPPVVTGDVTGRQFVVRGMEQGSLDVGAPVFFRRVPVGRVLSTDLNRDGTGVTVRVFIAAPYDRYVTASTRFWNASGIDLTLDSNGFKIRTQSLVSVLLGGIAFETPTGASTEPEANEHAEFTLFADRDQAMKAPDRQAIKFTTNFAESLRGLSVGSPVEFHGLLIGEVTAIGAEYEVKSRTYRFPVELTLYPDRLGLHFKTDMARTENAGLMTKRELDHLIEHGLRAQLNTGSLLTGQLFVALDFFPNADKASADWTKIPPELPTTPGGFSGLQNHLASLAKKLNQVPLDAIVVDVRRTLTSMRTTLQATEQMARRLDRELTPKAEEVLEESRRALLAMERILASDAPLQQDARETLRQLGRAAQSLQTLADFLERHPDSLIRGRRGDMP